MEVRLFKCSCGSTVFFNTVPHQFEEKDINNWNTFGLKAYAGTAAVLICLDCFKVHVPPANFSGKSRLDPNVIAYGEMLKSIESHNVRLEKSTGCSCIPMEDELGKLDKQLVPTKVSVDEKGGSAAPKSQEPRNKTKVNKTKTPKVKKPTKKSMQEQTVSGPN